MIAAFLNTPAPRAQTASHPLVCVVDDLGRKPHPGPVCVVIDVRLPGLDGFELQKMLADRGEQLVFLTGHGDVPMCVKAMKAGRWIF